MPRRQIAKTIETQDIETDDEVVRTVDDTTEKTVQMIYYLTGFVNVLLLLRLIFRAFGANPASGIVQVIYGLSNVLLIPFRGIFETAASGEFVIEPSILVAMVLYSLLAKGIVELIYILVKE